jgi:hypothetical protein
MEPVFVATYVVCLHWKLVIDLNYPIGHLFSNLSVMVNVESICNIIYIVVSQIICIDQYNTKRK